MPNPQNHYAVSLADLEASAHVPVDEQIETQPERVIPVSEDEAWVRQQQFLRQAGAP